MIAVASKPTVKPLLKWAGSKFGTPIADRVSELYQPYRDTHTFIEPFCGVLGMTLSVMPDRAILIDAAPEIVGLHQWVKEGGRFVELPSQVTPENYKDLRDEFKSLQQFQPGIYNESSDRFYSLLVWLNRACYNGLWRVNSKGLFNVPVGKTSKGDFAIVTLPELSGVRSVLQLQDWNFIKGDFTCGIHYLPSLIYADPPYFGTHSSYTTSPFTWQDQIRLANWLASQPYPVIASNSNHPDIIALYKELGFEIELIPVKRSINCTGDRQPATEMLATKGF